MQNRKTSRQPRRLILAVATLAGLTLSLTARADAQVEQGKTLATKGAGSVLACATCHGAQGQGMATFPYLAGQGSAYLERQLQDFASGARNNPVMGPVAKAMSAAQMSAVAAYYAQLPPPFNRQTLGLHIDTYPAKGDTGAWLANRGDWANNIPACVQCHGPGGVGVGGDFPAIAGLPAAYIAEQLQAWKSGQRTAGPQALMGQVAQRLSAEQIQAVSSYYAALPANAQPGAEK